MNRFEQQLAQQQLELRRAAFQTLQVNVGRKCNQACRHCHVDAAPWRTESMDSVSAGHIAQWIKTHRPATLDITGGAPELCPEFRTLVTAGRQAGCEILDRCNLTILREPGYDWLAEFLADHQVTIIASLPCHEAENVNRQRGNGVFNKSIVALQQLNELGYGTHLKLHLVYNPIGPTLPPNQRDLEAEYREALSRDHGIRFNHLYTITNQPIARFAEDLRQQNRWDEYMELLANNFNPNSVENLMCRTMISVDYQGFLYDCDFNQMLNLSLASGHPLKLWEISPDDFIEHPIRTGDHCLACTAGSGSSCTGVLT